VCCKTYIVSYFQSWNYPQFLQQPSISEKEKKEKREPQSNAENLSLQGITGAGWNCVSTRWWEHNPYMQCMLVF
jgi:hypothetical protein